MTEILGHSPDAYAIYAYESTVAVIQAIDAVGEKDRGKILDALFATKDSKAWSEHLVLHRDGRYRRVDHAVNEIKPNDEGKLDLHSSR